MSLTTADLRAALRAKYPAPGFMVLEELRNATGFDANRSADAIVIGLYRSRGLFVHGYEMKVSRSDWQRELKNHDKAEDFAQYCDFWHLLASEESIVQKGELPAGWGFWTVKKGKMVQHVAAEQITAKPMSRVLLAALLQASHSKATLPVAQELQKIREEEYERGKAAGMLEVDRGDLQNKLTRLQTKVKEFEEASGVTIEQRWPHDAKMCGRAVKQLLDGNESLDAIKRRLLRLVEDADGIKEHAKGTMKRLLDA